MQARQKLLTGILIFNPISFIFILFISISVYGFLLFAVSVFGIIRGLKQFVLDELGQYLDADTIQKIRNFKVYEPKKDTLETPRYGAQLLLIPLLFSYAASRIAIWIVLYSTQMWIRFLISLGPILTNVVRWLFQFTIKQINLLRYVMNITLVPLLSRLVPVIEYVIEVSTQTCFNLYRFWKTHGPELIQKLKNWSTRWFSLVFSFSRSTLYMAYYYCQAFYYDYFCIFIEQAKHVMWRVYPHIRTLVMSILAVCEYMDDQLRPILTPILRFIWIQSKLLLLLFWNSAGSICQTIFIPFQLVKSATVKLSRLTLRMTKRAILTLHILCNKCRPLIKIHLDRLKSVWIQIQSMVIKYDIFSRIKVFGNSMLLWLYDVISYLDSLTRSFIQYVYQALYQASTLFHHYE